MKRTPLKRKPRKKQPGDDPEYLAWIRTLPCSVQPCKRATQGLLFYFIEAHHAGDHGFGKKAPDRTAIPLCFYHHRDNFGSVHIMGKHFWKFHNLDRDQIIHELNERYDQLHA